MSDETYDEFDDLDSLPDPDVLEEQETAHEYAIALLERMNVGDFTVSVALSEVDDRGEQVIELDIDGESVAHLVGRHEEILLDMQYILRLMVSQQLHRRVNFVIDIAGHRRQRREGLTRLAERMADKAVRRNSAVTLEPMSPYERRIVHMALRDKEDVYTESVGEGRERRVRIFVSEE